MDKKNKIKVLHIIRPAEGGMKDHLFSLVTNIDAQKFELFVACPPMSSVALRLQEKNIKVLPVDIVGEFNFIKDLKAIKKLRSLIIKHRPHLIHTHGAKAGYIGRLAGILAGKPEMVTTVHNFVLENALSLWKKELFKVLEKGLSNYTSSIITVSEALRNHLIDSYGIKHEKVKTIYNGVNLKKFAKEQPEFEFSQELAKHNVKSQQHLVGVIARLAPQKGVKYFVKAAELVLKEIPTTRFIIVGDGPEKNALIKLTNKLRLNDYVNFMGERNDVPDILKKLDLFVLPSISEGLSITTIEALAAECPIVATSVGGVPEIIKDGKNGLLVKPQNPFELAKGIVKLLQDKKLSKKLALNGKVFVKDNFDQSIMVRETTKIYLKLLEDYLPASLNVIY